MLSLLASQHACDSVAADKCLVSGALRRSRQPERHDQQLREQLQRQMQQQAASAAARSAVALTSSSPVVAQPAAIATKSARALALSAVFFILEGSLVR